jgi:formylglycine-generating enzyme required for sulfatase activity
LVLISISSAQAARLALVIGNDAYSHVDKLANARNDARLMAQTLREAQFEVTMLENQDGKSLFRALETFGKRVQSGDEVVFFFAGHGVQINNDAVLLPTDIRAESDKQVLREGLQLSDVQDALKDAKVSLLVIDACRDNPFPKVGTRSIGGTRGLIAPEVRGQAVILSAGRNQKALDRVPNGSGNNGLFTHEFVKSIKGGLDLRAALVQVRDSVDDQAKRINHDQRPSVVDDLRGNFYFFAPVTIVTTAPSTPAVRLQTADEIEQQAWDATQQANSAAAFNAYLSEYPKGRFASAARVRLAGLSSAVQLSLVDPYPAGKVFKDCADCPEMVVIPAGSFTMGSNTGHADEKPPHSVNLQRFALAQTEVTQRQWQAVMGSNPSRLKQSGLDAPVENVSWNDAQSYVQKLSQMTGQRYHLPSESQWEYAARAGSSANYSFGNDDAALGLHAWYEANSDGKSQPVKQKQANAFGLYDMHGNVWEWVQDCWNDNYQNAPSNGSARETGDCSRRAMRGGSWNDNPAVLRAALRVRDTTIYRNGNDGFRPARTLP